MNRDATTEEIRESVAIVEKWSEEHPLVTNGMKVLEMIPGNERVAFSKTAKSERGFITSGSHVEVRIRKSWWDAEYKEGEK